MVNFLDIESAMKNMNQYDYEAERDYLGDKLELSKEMMGILMKDIMNREAGNIIPDTTGADKFFIDGFITGKMWSDFWTIAKDFLSHHFKNLEEFNSLNAYTNAASYQSDPENALKIRILSIMYKAAKAGDEYSVGLFQYLYKTYYKKEYKQLKRFRKISVPEIFSLAENEYGNINYDSLARIMGMCSLFGVEMDDKVSVLYVLLESAHKEIDKEGEINFFNFPEGLYQECLDQIDQWIDEERSERWAVYDYARYFEKLENFVARCLERFGYPSDYIYRSSQEIEEPAETLAVTLALLKCTFPKEEFTYKEVQVFAHTYQAIAALVSVCDMYDESMHELFGGKNHREVLWGEECLFKPENVFVKKAPAKPIAANAVQVKAIKDESVKESDYINEIADLRRKLREKEEESKYFKAQFDQAQLALKEAKSHAQKYENDREELIALRNHVYNMSEQEVAEDEITIEEMTKVIAEYKAVIVGGHTNWVNKLKKQFPKWKFFDASISRINEAMVLNGTEKVYFFTDHISHGTYGKYIAMVRENKIPFGYLHSVNMETLIRQIYRDFCYNN